MVRQAADYEPAGSDATDRAREPSTNACVPCRRCAGLEEGEAMTSAPGPVDPDVRPPFWRHRYYYLALKIVVLACAVYFAVAAARLPVRRPDGQERLYLFDTTLRDGAQTTGVDFSLEDKRLIVRMLDELGIDYIEGGYPGANPTDTEFFSTDPGLETRHLHRLRHDQAQRPLARQRSGLPGHAASQGRRRLPGRQGLGLSRARGARRHQRGEPRRGRAVGGGRGQAAAARP